MGDDLERRVRRIEATHEISQLASRYALAVDMRDSSAMLSLFADAGQTFDAPTLGLREIRPYAESKWAGIEESILLVCNHVMDIGDDRATGVVYSIVKFATSGEWCEQAVRYDDHYLLTGKGWRFLSRRHSLWYGQVQPTNPMAQEPANWPHSQIGRGTLPYEWQSWRKAVGAS